MVAQLRGAEFEWRERRLRPVDDYESPYITDEALIDVSYWLGFSDIGEYVRDLGRLKEKIFDRAKD